ncbi:DUF952 domain-containing protein [Lutibaculum baratangense]|uniref:DUF952 domain-containing protein n=1 Tax=Lutibaculum baratangense TaxID=1358440 RepID=UPI00058F5E10|nr:DUF952 domain-containing protein [Lutibaculum baratangense]
MPYIVYKICSADEWRTAEERGEFDGNPDDERDGFVHLSNADQVEGTLEKHFAGRKDLVLIGFDADALPSLRWEPSRRGEMFPHHYGSLPLAAVFSVEPITAPDDGEAAEEA